MAIQNDGGGNAYGKTLKPTPSWANVAPKGPVVPRLPAAPKQPARTAQPVPLNGLNDTFGGGGGGYSAPSAPAQSDDDYLASGADSAYTAQLAALMKALENYEADSTAQRSKYEVDYGSTLKNLGWNQDDPSTPDVDEGAWNFSDTNTAAGRAFQNQQNDFAGRGLLQSSLYGTANDNLTRSLNDQLSGINSSKQSFFDDLTRQGTAFKNDNTLAQQQARAEAIQRRAGQIAI